MGREMTTRQGTLMHGLEWGLWNHRAEQYSIGVPATQEVSAWASSHQGNLVSWQACSVMLTICTVGACMHLP